MNVISSPFLPLPPTPAEDVVRIVRHGLSDVLEWLGEPVGPKPGEATHALIAGEALMVSQEVYDRLAAEAKEPSNAP